MSWYYVFYQPKYNLILSVNQKMVPEIILVYFRIALYIIALYNYKLFYLIQSCGGVEFGVDF